MNVDSGKVVNAVKVSATVAAGAVAAEAIGSKAGNPLVGTAIAFGIGVAGIFIKGSYGTYFAAGAILPPVMNAVENVVKKII
ncbi:hypothetical protein [Archaeoglobus veneficus]|uniref:Uncharacterized protein n=1 Tax=Archaeoglobus veneficus (strain DSM 11195 / SNP6) TaxID=693661 RepID=F2KR54_ARCVS|nr:hypothetical protein [Archaeoglobus veneficus]AEA46691.1 hypothetical protein Arcve_0671 [Archaeoglobus veneficus SNP6]